MPYLLSVLSNSQPFKMLHEKHMYRCPFCKTSNYAVEYRGVKSKEEKGQEQIDEQMVIEAKIRMRQQELQDEEERQSNEKELSSSRTAPQAVNPPCSSSTVAACEEYTSQGYSATQRQPQNSRQNRTEELNTHLLVMVCPSHMQLEITMSHQWLYAWVDHHPLLVGLHVPLQPLLSVSR